ncbi:MAG: hypothetical protein IJ523_11420 [Succinivibrionaceae bacterium]|nr:hypothetical protein [Succinivibrionaceae bacterium]
MGKAIVTALILALIYVLARMFTSGITVDSEVYGYYKDGRLNERGIISLVQQVKRLIPIKTQDTTVVGITYNYEDGSPPKGQLNYYHRIDDDKVDFYLAHRQEVVNHMAYAQCANHEVVEMLEKLEKITVSFYRHDRFLFGLEVSAAMCRGDVRTQAREIGEVKDATDPPLEDKTEAGAKDDGADEARTGTEKARSGKDGAPAADKVDGDGRDDSSAGAVSSHISIITPNLPIKTSFGSLLKVEPEDGNGVRHVFDVNGNELRTFDQKKTTIIRGYCGNAHLASLLKHADHITLEFTSGGNTFKRWRLTEAACAQAAGN